MMVYVARYGHQPYSEIRAVPLATFYALFYGLIELIKGESEPQEG